VVRRVENAKQTLDEIKFLESLLDASVVSGSQPRCHMQGLCSLAPLPTAEDDRQKGPG
jgi:hypothetical protein